jgi:2-polyprenyl-3-methyl-5-hydroxy-6-metoxy-1,4-benzoquinol methylase
MGYYGKDRIEMLAYVPFEAKRILEVGCGEGRFLRQLIIRQKAEIWGVEVDIDSAKIAKDVVDKIIINDITKVMNELPDNYFDCVIFNDVLEHLVDPYAILKNISYKIESNGVIVSSLPNVRYYKVLYHLVVSKRWDYRDSGVLDKTHLRFFTFNNIRELFENNGYSIVILQGINPTTSFLYKLINFIFFGFFYDSRFIQFVCVAKVSK